MPRYAVRLYNRHQDETAWIQTEETAISSLEALAYAVQRGYAYTVAEIYDEQGERTARYEVDR